jgi:hypothetical protein
VFETRKILKEKDTYFRVCEVSLWFVPFSKQLYATFKCEHHKRTKGDRAHKRFNARVTCVWHGKE